MPRAALVPIARVCVTMSVCCVWNLCHGMMSTGTYVGAREIYLPIVNVDLETGSSPSDVQCSVSGGTPFMTRNK
jgi:hypothetical protein